MSRLDPGWFGVAPPALWMREEQTRRIQVTAGRKNLRKLMEHKLGETSKSFVGTDIPLGTRLHVEIVAGNPNNFKIAPLYPGMEDQDISLNEVTTWTFDVTALKAGRKQRLVVKAWSLTDRFGNPISLTARTVRDISELTVDVDVVDVGWWERIKATLAWAIGILTGIAALYGAWRKVVHPQQAQG